MGCPYKYPFGAHVGPIFFCLLGQSYRVMSILIFRSGGYGWDSVVSLVPELLLIIHSPEPMREKKKKKKKKIKNVENGYFKGTRNQL